MLSPRGELLLKILMIQASWMTGAYGGIHESRLLETLFKSSVNTAERPSENDSQPLKVEFMITLQQIVDVDEKNQVIITNLWQSIKWTDYKFRWNPPDYGNITDIRLPVAKLWKPDILMYNSASSSFDGSYPSNVVVQHTGQMEQIPPGLFTSSCTIEIRWFPFDDQKCTMKFGSWSYDGTKIDLRLPDGQNSASTDGFSENGEWDLIEASAQRNVVLYECCPDNPFYDITFTLHIRRRKLYYMVNIVAPCMMLSALTLLTFCIPPDAGEKISFGVTILLSLTVFLLLVAELLPATSDAIPLVSIYFSIVMVLNALSVLFTVVVLGCHFRNGDSHEMPLWVKRGVCEWLAWILRMQRRGDDLERELRRSKAGVGGGGGRRSRADRQRDVELADRSADDTQPLHQPLASSPLSGYESCASSSPCSPALSVAGGGGGGGGGRGGEEVAAAPGAGGGRTCGRRSGRVPAAGGGAFFERSDFAYGPALAVAVTEKGFGWPPVRRGYDGRNGDGSSGGQGFCVTRFEAQAILREVRYVTARIRESDRDDSVTADWKFAAAVGDRLLLVIFSIVTLVATLCILFSAPNFFESS